MDCFIVEQYINHHYSITRAMHEGDSGQVESVIGQKLMLLQVFAGVNM
jgi:hypothetical protein